MSDITPVASGAQVEAGGDFYRGSSGRWAGEQFLKALQEGKELSASALRTLDTLRHEEWIFFDEALVEAATIRLKGVAALIAAGLTVNIPGSLGRTMYQYDKVSDMQAAQTTMSGRATTDDDRVDFTYAQLPLPITHKDFGINLRTLIASRTKGESLDTTQVRVAGRLIAERLEYMLFNGATGTYGGVALQGLLNYTNRNTASFGTNGAWSAAAKTGENILADVHTLIDAAVADRFYGPYWIFVPADAENNLADDFKAASDKTTRQRILEDPRIAQIIACDQLTTANVVLVQPTVDVIAMAVGEPLQTVQWDIEGGFHIKFKGFTIQVPLIRSDYDGRCGVVHMS
jgi:uncharacterized linocin/CFP29 family protein